jgi:hypothetical protein
VASVGATPAVSPEVEHRGDVRWPRWLLSVRRIANTRVSASAGIVMVAAGLGLPWLGVPLEPEKRATSLRVVFAGMPTASWASYGTAVAACLAVAVVAFVVTRGRGSSLLAAAGAGALLVPLIFVVQAVLSDFTLLQHLRQQQTELASVTSQFGYGEPRSSVTSVFLLPLRGPWRAVATQLRPGWFLCVAGGALILTAGAGPARRELRRRRTLIGLSLIGLAGTLLIGRGIAANLVADSALDPLRAGDYDTALSRLDLAESLNPDIRINPDEELARGQALAAGGNRASAPALLYVARVRSASGDQPGALLALQEAVQRSPGDVVVRAELLRLSRTLALASNDPGPLEFILGPTAGEGLLAEHYALGRILYARADYQQAILELQRAAQQSGAEPNVASSALTYIALSEMRLGRSAEARQDLLHAVDLDTEYINSLARSLSTGLYTTGPR